MHHDGATHALDRGDVDDRSAARRLHRLDRSLHAEKRARQVDVDDLLPLRHVELADLAEGDDAGVVHQNVELAELVDRGGNRGVPLLGRRDVEVHIARGVTDLVGQRLALLVEDVADHHLGALGHQSPRVLCAHAPSAATDQCNFSVHASHDGSGYLARVLQVEPVPVLREGKQPWRSASRSSAPATVAASRCKQLVNDARFDLTGVWVSHGRQGGQGRGRAGRAGCDDRLSPRPMTSTRSSRPNPTASSTARWATPGWPRPWPTFARILAAGIDVVGSAPGVLQYPWQVIPDKYIERIEDAAREGNSSVFMTGVDPGFATDLLPFALAGTCQSIEQVRTMEIADYATYDGATVMFDVMGFGNQIGDFPMLFQPGVLSIAWGTAIRQLAAGLGIEVDEIRDSVEQEPAPEDFDIAAGHIAKGTVAALRFQIEGMVKGKPVIVVEHVTRLRGDLRPDWAQPAQPGGSYRVEIVGEPSYAMDICPTSRSGDHNYAAILAAAGRIVNAIPDVVAAPPGIRTTLDMPLVTGRGLYAAT